LKWNLARPNTVRSDVTAAAALARDLDISPLTARVLVARGFDDSDSAHRFLAPSLDDLHDPGLLKSMPEAVARLRRAIDAKQPILLYGDYDVDGTSAIVILKKGLDLLGAVASFHVPHRLRDGYGMKSQVIEQAAAAGVKLIVSVDTGIRANDVVRHAAEFGIDVIVTDHHLPESELPPAVAVLNPNRRDCSYPEKNLCGAGVALKLMDALVTASGWDAHKRGRLVESLLKLVAIATVADVVPLTGENRAIVKLGLAGLGAVRNPGLRAILDVSGLADGASPTARQVAFQVAPRINASGRMASAADVIEMFMTDDESRARALAAQLEDLNLDRRQTESEIARAIFEQCVEQPVTDLDCALVFSGEGWHRGVVGIVASRVVERFHRPAFVLSIENGLAQGSGRSIAAFHLLDALESMPELFTKFGGHRQAAGITLHANQVDEFRSRFRAHAASLLTAADFEPSIDIDAEVDLREINDESVADLFRLAPFGFGNPPPVFAARAVEIAGSEIKKDKHVFARLISNGRQMRVKAWNFAHRADEFAAGARVDVVFSIEDDAFSAGRGYAPWQAILRDLRPAAAHEDSAEAFVAGS
jgi:single-stranded-DNA-specific exonuclease